MKSINWLNSIGQVVLIFIGVSVATLFENWNSDRNRQEREIQLLKQMKVDLQHDLDDLNGNKRSATRKLASCNILVNELTSDRPYADSLGRYFGALPIYSLFISNVGSYETLKALGIDMIENDTLREKIVNLYEGMYTYVGQSGKVAHEYSLNILIPGMAKNFTNVNIGMNRGSSMATPVNYTELKKNSEFIEQLRILASFQKIDILSNSNLISAIEQLRGDIDEEIKRLD